MTYAIARARVVAIVEGTVPGSTLTYAEPFAHHSFGHPVPMTRSRLFRLLGMGGGESSFAHPEVPNILGTPRISSPMQLRTLYRRAMGAEADADVDVVSDMRALCIALSNPANVNPATHSIHYIVNTRWSRVPLPNGDAEAILSFDMVWF